MRQSLRRIVTSIGIVTCVFLISDNHLLAQCPDPGEATVCKGSGDIIVLADLITGENPGGIWSRETGVGGVFNDMAGTYDITASADSSIFIYTVEMGGGLPDCETEVIVNVTQDPIYTTVCHALNIGISDGNPDLIAADSLISTAKLGCAEIVNVQARRLELVAACGYGANLVLSDSVGFCCLDIGNTIMVEVVTTYVGGHMDICMSAVTIADKNPPIIADPPSDVTISCTYPLNVNNLSVFGGFAYYPNHPKIFTLSDPWQETDPNITEGKIIENCPDNLIIDESVSDLRECGQGEILRIFSIHDPGSMEIVVDTQTITIENFRTFGKDSIIWPRDTMIESCVEMDGDVSLTGEPTFKTGNICVMPMFTSSDLVFDDPNSGCIVIERTWKVIDWCQYDHETKSGVWYERQYIKLKNKMAPEFNNFIDSLDLCTPAGACEGLMDISIDVSDDCTLPENIKVKYAIELNNDGSLKMEGYGNSIKELLPRGEHIIHWTATDRCGNYTEKTQVVFIKECKAPSPVCLQGIAISLSTNGEVEIWASDFNNSSSDNCTPSPQLRYSFSDDPTDGFTSFNCDNVGLVDLEVWVTDLDGNQSYCLTTIDVQDNLEGCSDGDQGGIANAMISGQVYSEMNTPIDDAQINISGPEMEDYRMTAGGGKYIFENLPSDYEYELIPTKDDYPLMGVTTLDLVKIQRHVLGVKTLDSPYKMIAADVNNSQSISAADLIQLRKLILGIYDHFPENNSWRFVESKFGIMESDNPWPFIEGMLVPNLATDIMEGDFIGIKIGDVDNTVEDNLRNRGIGTRSTEEFILEIEDLELKAGEVREVQIKTKNAMALLALQWTISLDDEKVNIVNWDFGNLPINGEQTAIIHGEGLHFTLAWSDLESIYVQEGDKILTLTLEAKEDIILSEIMNVGSTITDAIAFNDFDEAMNVSLEWNKQVGDLVLFQNAPNPFIDHTYISFDMPEEGVASFIVTDISGRVLHQVSESFPSGNNRISIRANELDVPAGVLYYSLNYGGKILTKKMILLR
jgi:hypothetical protein